MGTYTADASKHRSLVIAAQYGDSFRAAPRGSGLAGHAAELLQRPTELIALSIDRS